MVVLVTALALGFVAWRPPVYTSRAQVEVRPLTIDEQLQPFASDSFVNMDTEAARVTQEPVAKLAAPALGLDPDSPADLAEAVAGVDVSVQANTTFLESPAPRTARLPRETVPARSPTPTSRTGWRAREASTKTGCKRNRRRSRGRTTRSHC